MLQKFLFVGLGGSGGKTLRYLHEDLRRRLDAERWNAPMPSAWQFLHIDVPTLADGTSPDLPAQLSRRSYVGLAPPNMSYSSLDELLTQQGAEVLRGVAAWRPRADRVGINPTVGAGQFRAVGRTITAASIRLVVDAIRRSVAELQDINNDDELARLSLILTGDSTVTHDMPPQVVLVSSVAGGSGAGSFLDAADVIRNLGETWGGESVGILYLPDVFSDVPEASRVGVTANALASLSELMNAYWSDGTLTETGDVALLMRAGVASEYPGRRGPRYPMLIGRSNAVVRFATQNEVYRVTAKAIASWITSGHVQDQMRAYVHGQWALSAEGRGDATGLTSGEGLEVPFSSLGFGSVGLGRDRFAQYSRERLAAYAVDHLLRAHVTEEVRAELITPEEAAQTRARQVRHQFMDRCRLRELGPEDNQILDAIRGGSDREARRVGLDQLRNQIRKRAAGTGDDIDVQHLRQVVLAANTDFASRLVGELFENDAQQARSWSREIQDRIVDETALLLGQEGARVTEAVLEDVAAELLESVVAELHHEQAAANSYAEDNDNRVRSKFAGVKGRLPGQSRPVADAVEECVRSAHAKAEARLHELVAALIIDLVQNFVIPLRQAVLVARRGLEVEDQGTPEKPSVIKTWTRKDVPRVLEPAQNEILLEPTASYPESFSSRVGATTGERDEGTAIAFAVREVVAGLEPHNDEVAQDLITFVQRWVPTTTMLSLETAPAKAQFRVVMTGEALQRRAGRWVRSPGTPMSDFIDESLRSYLDDSGRSPHEASDRLDRFKVGLGQALAASKPLVKIDPARATVVHGEAPGSNYEAISPLPFPPSHPARSVIAEVFHDRGSDELSRLYDDGDASSIEITTILGANYMPAAIASVYESIASDWAKRQTRVGQGGFWDRRRARRLPEFIPAPPEKIRYMLKGWHVARLMNWVKAGNPNMEPSSIWTANGEACFPFPLLGPPITDLRDLFPAILESMPLALLADPQPAMAAYHQLEALGSSQYQQHDSMAEEARHALRYFLQHGQLPANAPSPALALTAANRAEDRIEFMLERLDDYLKAYEEELRTGYAPTGRVSRTWELAGPLVNAVRELRKDIEAMAGSDSSGVVW